MGMGKASLALEYQVRGSSLQELPCYPRKLLKGAFVLEKGGFGLSQRKFVKLSTKRYSHGHLRGKVKSKNHR